MRREPQRRRIRRNDDKDPPMRAEKTPAETERTTASTKEPGDAAPHEPEAKIRRDRRCGAAEPIRRTRGRRAGRTRSRKKRARHGAMRRPPRALRHRRIPPRIRYGGAEAGTQAQQQIGTEEPPERGGVKIGAEIGMQVLRRRAARKADAEVGMHAQRKQSTQQNGTPVEPDRLRRTIPTEAIGSQDPRAACDRTSRYPDIWSARRRPDREAHGAAAIRTVTPRSARR